MTTVTNNADLSILTPCERATLRALADLRRAGVDRPRHAEVARRAGHSAPNVGRALGLLAACGLVPGDPGDVDGFGGGPAPGDPDERAIRAACDELRDGREDHGSGWEVPACRGPGAGGFVRGRRVAVER